MMKKWMSVFVSFVLLLAILSACGEETSISDDDGNKASAADKKDSSQDNNNDKDKDQDSDSSKKKKEDDIWTYYNGSTWSDNYKGFKTKIKKAVVSDVAPAEDGSDEEQSAVGVKFLLASVVHINFIKFPHV